MVANSSNDPGRAPANPLDASLVDSDGFLTRSLNQDERGRRQRRRVVVAGCSLALFATIVVAASIITNKLIASDKSAHGWALWSQRRLPEAEAKFREALMENDKDSDAWTGLGWSLTNTGRLKEAMDAFKKALALTPENASAQNGLGQCALGSGDLAVAEEYLKKSSDGVIKLAGGEDKLKPTDIPAAWYGLVNVYLLKDDFDQAKQWVDRIAKVDPKAESLTQLREQIEKRDSTPTKRMFGRDTAGKKSDKNAEKGEKGAENNNSKRAQAWQMWRGGQLKEATELFRELVKSDPQDTNSQNGLGWCLFNSGDAKAAHEAFKRCLELDASHGAALNGAGQSALALHEWATAEEYLQKASDSYLKEIPEDKLSAENLPAAWYGLVRVHLVQGNYDKAILWAERILKHDAKSTEVQQMLDSAKKKDNSQIKKMFGVE